MHTTGSLFREGACGGRNDAVRTEYRMRLKMGLLHKAMPKVRGLLYGCVGRASDLSERVRRYLGCFPAILCNAPILQRKEIYGMT